VCPHLLPQCRICSGPWIALLNETTANQIDDHGSKKENTVITYQRHAAAGTSFVAFVHDKQIPSKGKFTRVKAIYTEKEFICAIASGDVSQFNGVPSIHFDKASSSKLFHFSMIDVTQVPWEMYNIWVHNHGNDNNNHVEEEK
jgi:hypothetical protein